MRHIWISIVLLPLLLVVLPLAGVIMKDAPLAPYLEFPPLTIYVQHAPFSWSAFVLLALLLTSVSGPLILRIVQDSGLVPAVFLQNWEISASLVISDYA